VGAAEALQMGLIDAVIEGDLLNGAIAFAKAAAPAQKTRERDHLLGTAEGNAAMFASARQMAAKVRRRQNAPLKAIEAVEAATSLPFEQGCERERALFNEVIKTDQAKAMMHAFFAERAAAKVSGIGRDTAVLPVKKVAVVGAGTMGGGITMAFVNAGFEVTLREARAEALENGMARIRANYETSVKRGRFTAEEVDKRMALIHPQLDLAGFESADLIIEAVFENMALKKQVLQELDKVAKPGCIIASNTSTLNVDELASVTSRPEAVLGMHFFSPANVMRLLEIVRGSKTSPVVLATAIGVAKLLKKVGVVVGNCPGFVGNRMFFPYIYEGH
jgi:3-hydroxyacyl-CoA dehydrogenase